MCIRDRDNPYHLFRICSVLALENGIDVRFIQKQVPFAVYLSDNVIIQDNDCLLYTSFFLPDTRTFVRAWVMECPTHHFALGVGHHAATLKKIGDALGIETAIVRP